MTTTRRIWSLSALLLAVGCGGDERVCAPGVSVACVGPAGCAGGQVCAADGTSYGACDCVGASDAGPDANTPDAAIIIRDGGALPAEAYGDMQWTIRCLAMAGCTSYPIRDVNGFDGDRGIRLSCNVVETDRTRTLSFSASADTFGLSLQDASFPRLGGTPTNAGCVVRVSEDNNYVGACGGGPPTPAQPCQVNNVAFTSDAEGRSLIRGNILCGDPTPEKGAEIFGISPAAAPSLERELTAPGTDLAARSMPMQFNIYDCPGYHPD